MTAASATITTIIPTYRRPRLLRRAIESVLGQSFRDVRVCVYDNASEDETQSVVESIVARDSRVSYFRNPTNIGAFANIKQGVANVKTEYYCLLSDDDFLLPGFLTLAASAFEAHSDIGFACGKVVIADEVRGRVRLLNQDWTPARYSPSSSTMWRMYGSHFASTGVVFRTAVRQALGALDPIGNDVLYMTLAAGTWAFAVLDLYAAVFTLRSDSFSYAVGLAGLPIEELNSALAENIDQISRLPASPALKAHMSMLATHSYQRTVDAKRFKVFLGRGPAADRMGEAWPPTSPAQSAHGFGIRAFEMAPGLLRGVLSIIIGWAMRLRRSRSAETARWERMTPALRGILLDAADAETVMATLRAAPYQIDAPVRAPVTSVR